MRKVVPLGQAALLLTASSLSACATGPALLTVSEPTAAVPERGVPYYLPYDYLPVTVVGQPVQATGPAPPYTGNVTIGNLTAMPDVTDPNAPHFLKYTHDVWADDAQTISVSPTGLLEAASMTETDQTASVIAEVAQLVGQVASLPVAFAAPVAAVHSLAINLSGCCTMPAFSWNVMLDPAGRPPSAPLTSPTTDSLFHDRIRFAVADGNFTSPTDPSQYINITAFSTPMGAAAAPSPTTQPRPEAVGGILFRAPALYLIDINIAPSTHTQQFCGILPSDRYQFVSVPNGGRLFVEDVTRARGVKKSVTLTIQDGMLTGVSPQQQSEVNAYAAVPVTVLNTLLAIPSNLLTLHIAQTQQAGNLTADQAALLQDELNVLNNQAALAKAQGASH